MMRELANGKVKEEESSTLVKRYEIPNGAC
jgi:hypothetical protein